MAWSLTFSRPVVTQAVVCIHVTEACTVGDRVSIANFALERTSFARRSTARVRRIVSDLRGRRRSEP
jgi:hypothetical protein